MQFSNKWIKNLKANHTFFLYVPCLMCWQLKLQMIHDPSISYLHLLALFMKIWLSVSQDLIYDKNVI